ELAGGVGVYTRNLIGALRSRDLEVDLVTPHPAIDTDASTVIAVKPTNGRASWLPHAWRFARALRRVDEPYDIVHFTDARYSVFLRHRPWPVVGTMNDYFYTVTGWFRGTGTWDLYHDWVSRHLYYNFIRTLERGALRRLDAVICISGAVADRLHDRYDIPTERLTVVPYGIVYRPADAKPLPKRGPTILFAGGNFQRKGLEVLIRASRRVLDVVPDAVFVVLGDSAGTARMKRLCDRRGVGRAFSFEGQVDYHSLYRHYRTADVFAMPSLLEAFGIPYLEAMHCGVPVVATIMPGPDDYLRDGANALLSEPGDDRSLARDIVRLLTDPELRSRLVEAGRATARQFTPSAMGDRTLRVYESAIARRA
ncbi:MAG: glycosyltransferase family 4 protein, partial [Halobacteriales archaeon]|nr:glycosyltransferase family 4 protein [Halobacteriales archaeon]